MASEEPLFDPSLMKKKKGKKADLTKELDALDEPAPAAAPAPEAAAESTATATDAAAPAAEAADEENMFADLKKKKKSKKLIPMDLDDLDNACTPAAAATPGDATPAAPAEGEAENDDLDFGEMKKKKKKGGKKAAFDLEAFEKELGEDSKGEGASSGTTAAAPAAGGEGGEDEDLGDDPFAAGDDGEEAGEAQEAVETWHGTDRDYTYQELLGRVFSTLRAQNPAMAGEKKKYTIVPPQVMRDGSKKTVFANVVEICKRMHRQPDHVIQYLFSELGTEGSVDGAQRLVIKGRFQPKQIENVLRRYILEYVTCKTCKSPRTLLTKENRIFFLVCEACGSQRSVTTIKTGFQAQTGKRSKMRAQT